MKIFSILILVLLAGCSTTQSVIVPKVQPDSSYMHDCGEWIIPDNTKASFTLSIVKNKETFDLCKKQNQGKKDFILDISK